MAKLYFYYSAMNAGKSTVLLQSSHNYQEKGMQTLLLMPALDNRYQYGTITSRIGLSEPAYAFHPQDNLYTHVLKSRAEKPYACVLIDEAQFLTREQVYQLTEITDQLSIPVLTYGLRTDFRGELFTGSQYLLAWADELIEIKTICHCGRKATMNRRINAAGEVIAEGEQLFIGGNESYVSTCRRHFKSRQTASETQPVP
ncbi:thymidine kinase [Legionella taurinensis]|uniref:Thymidine kinase n=1 Tax=Legionella taurinensis TaxID=70611 RepID=A0A3A5L4A7_9GAMM|nr:thymidine kinase [Legionella taurinensis]PUT38638.1 thymidine kinase [Legionella taurinensis]PUT39836.1 thymidine kinase [Legionella taurinensis]PUT41828.1 thymidine kinase [Legionella taurinensis]PUT45323.1 thymidine kinase [Legionella taurinensis]RJT43955.1 thymidine kinase [Legionella taurinensis]